MSEGGEFHDLVELRVGSHSHTLLLNRGTVLNRGTLLCRGTLSPFRNTKTLDVLKSRLNKSYLYTAHFADELSTHFTKIFFQRLLRGR